MNNMIQYKGYMAKIEYSVEDSVLIGTVIGVNDTLIFECDSLNDVEREFHDLIDDYLEMCNRMGKTPDKTYKGSFNVRISPELHKEAVLKAAALNMSLNELVAISIQHELDSKVSQKDVEQMLEKYKSNVRNFYTSNTILNNDYTVNSIQTKPNEWRGIIN